MARCVGTQLAVSVEIVPFAASPGFVPVIGPLNINPPPLPPIFSVESAPRTKPRVGGIMAVPPSPSKVGEAFTNTLFVVTAGTAPKFLSLLTTKMRLFKKCVPPVYEFVGPLVPYARK